MRAKLTAILMCAAGAAYAQPAAPNPDVTATAEPAGAWDIGVEPMFGVLVPTSKLKTFVVGGVEVDKAFGHLVIAADLALTRPSYSGTVMDPRLPGGMTSYSVKQTELEFAVLASYRFADESATLVPHVGAGPLLHMLKTNETSGAAPGENTAGQTTVGVVVDGGADYRIGPGFLAGDLRVAYSGLDTFLSGSSNAGSVMALVGYRIVF